MKIKNVLKIEPERTKKIKNILRMFEAENRQNFKNIQPEPKKPGSYKKKKCMSREHKKQIHAFRQRFTCGKIELFAKGWWFL